MKVGDVEAPGYGRSERRDLESPEDWVISCWSDIGTWIVGEWMRECVAQGVVAKPPLSLRKETLLACYLQSSVDDSHMGDDSGRER